MTQELLNEIQKAVLDVSKHQRKDFTKDNLLMVLCCRFPHREPRELAEMYTQKYGNASNGNRLTGDSVITFYRKTSLKYSDDRRKIFNLAESVSDNLSNFIDGKGELPNLKCDHPQWKRIILLLLAEKNSFFKTSSLTNLIFRLNRDFANECFESILEIIQRSSNTKLLSVEDKLREELSHYKTKLNRIGTLLTELQDSFDAQMAESKQEMQQEFMARLNSEKYGHILDLLALAQNNFKLLRKNKKTVPLELKSVQTVVRRMLEFVEDCNVTPIREIGERLDLKAGELDGLQYEGTPFINQDEVKQLEVISPGWEIVEQQIIISEPRVREIIEENIHESE